MSGIKQSVAMQDFVSFQAFGIEYFQYHQTESITVSREHIKYFTIESIVIHGILNVLLIKPWAVFFSDEIYLKVCSIWLNPLKFTKYCQFD